MDETTNEKEGQTVYEIGYLVLPSIAEDKLSQVVDGIRGIITKAGGSEIAGEEPIKQDLAYTMHKTIGASRYVVNEAYIGWIKFEVDASKVESIKAGLDKMEEILRSLLIKAPRETGFTFAEARKALEEAPQEGEGEEVPAEGVPAPEVIE